MRDVLIRKLANGFVISVGCKEVVLEGNSSELGAKLADYFSSERRASEMEREFLKTHCPYDIAVAAAATPEAVPYAQARVNEAMMNNLKATSNPGNKSSW